MNDYVRLHRLIDTAAAQDRPAPRVEALRRIRRLVKSMIGLEDARRDSERTGGVADNLPDVYATRGGIRFPAPPGQSPTTVFPYGTPQAFALSTLLGFATDLLTRGIETVTYADVDELDAGVVAVRLGARRRTGQRGIQCVSIASIRSPTASGPRSRTQCGNSLVCAGTGTACPATESEAPCTSRSMT